MTQTTRSKPTVEAKTCANCPCFQSHNELEYLVDKEGDRFNNPRFGYGWCSLINRLVREHHQMTQECVLNGALDVEENEPIASYELEDNLVFFPEVEYEEFTAAFSTEELIDPNNLYHSEYSVGSVVKIIDADEDRTEWGVFEVLECKYNKNLNLDRDTETYLQHSRWYYRLSSNKDASAISKLLWVREDEICHFDMSHDVCTEDIF